MPFGRLRRPAAAHAATLLLAPVRCWVNELINKEKPMTKTCKSTKAAALVATATLLLVFLGERSALAREQGTEQERKACMPDVFRLCDAFIPNPEQIIACLQQNVSTLSPACRQVMDGAAQP